MNDNIENKKQILIVDDEDSLRILLKRHLELQGYEVKDTNSGLDALSILEQLNPDLIVSDIMMPQMDGLEFCQRLRSSDLGKLVPFIFLSSKGELEDRILGLSMGADDYINKPVEMRELVAKIEAQLDRSRRVHLEIKKLIEKHLTQTTKSQEIPEPLPLTPAEERVFWEVAQGLTNKQISDRLFISPRTVQTHLSKIMRKLSLENRSQLVRYAFENGYQVPTGQNVNEDQTLKINIKEWTPKN
ncbi:MULTISPECIES: response regulator transcription factor [Okeania]|uniref:DNA-binding response regulator n=1 Tax=Okeania hirsuta TaxID=1458930 RepID=A0A3N6PZ24_9CYAN|nr:MULTISPECIES: response regulator transcription factor [Okeania]NET12968.1 response regulator transcription factor [Okeania sp. SIO1H6]NES76779.1 response regulator transcription factor [Okeania sp. SIO1H4]NET20707.1 response regulator transcription factor [Okeania sp. SIO1H5]NET93824.1 response regulator transcription factor [Okeania sp. SIO1H2]RQH07730.1 DNA-binding response regulator [Okeania hirsuta]